MEKYSGLNRRALGNLRASKAGWYVSLPSALKHRLTFCTQAITIGGDYQYLQHVFMLAQNDFNGPRKTNKVIVYGVNTQDQDLEF